MFSNKKILKRINVDNDSEKSIGHIKKFIVNNSIKLGNELKNTMTINQQDPTLNSTTLSESLAENILNHFKINLENFLKFAFNREKNYINDSESNTISFCVKTSFENITIKLFKIDLNHFYDVHNFLYYYSVVFKKKFNNEEFCLIKKPNFKISFDLAGLQASDNSKDPINNNFLSLQTFKILTCLVFSIIFNIKIFSNYCVPETINELNIWKQNQGVNCFKQDCKLYLLTNNDPFIAPFITNCSNINTVQTAFVDLLIQSGVANINASIEQTINKS